MKKINFTAQFMLAMGAFWTMALPCQAADFAKIDSGFYHSVAVKTDGSLWAWGLNDYEQVFGDQVFADPSPNQFLSPVLVDGIDNWIDVASGLNFSLALRADGTLFGWGDNDSAQLGFNPGGRIYIPPQYKFFTSEDTDWVSIDAGRWHGMALKSNGTLWTWGQDYRGQLGNVQAPVSDMYYQRQVGSDSDWATIAAGDQHSLAIKTNGTLWAWGYNNNGQLGDGTTLDKTVPMQIGTDTDWTDVAGGGKHTVALKANGTLWTWGDNYYGQLGDGTNTDRHVPQQIGSSTDWVAIAIGLNHTIALKANGTLWAWGNNTFNRLGDGTSTSRNTPTLIASTTPWTAIAVGSDFTMALKANGTHWGWGNNDFGQLGDGTQSRKSLPPSDGDNDMIPDFEDSCPNDAGNDADGDTICGDWELDNELDPNDPADAEYDNDGDGLTSLYEYGLGTDPTLADSDWDGIDDGHDGYPLEDWHSVCGETVQHYEGATAYASVWLAYDSGQIQDDDLILITASAHSEDLLFDQNIVVTLSGGYDCTFSNNPVVTDIIGSLTISNGTVTVDNIAIK